jgi:hypothetical protein
LNYERLRIDTSARESQIFQVPQEDAKQLKLRLGEVSRKSRVSGVSVDVGWHRWLKWLLTHWFQLMSN